MMNTKDVCQNDEVAACGDCRSTPQGQMFHKIYYLEWLRVAAAGAVVMIHVVMGLSDNMSVASVGIGRSLLWGGIQALTRFAVPVFLMITGSLLLEPSRSIGLKKLIRYVMRMFAVLGTFGLAFCLMELVFQYRVITFSIFAQAVLNLLEGHCWNHMWYVYELIGLYLLLPLFRSFVASCTQKDLRIMLLVLATTTLLLPTMNAAFGVSFIDLTWLTSSAFYLLLGWYAHRHLVLKRSMAAVGIASFLLIIGIWAVGVYSGVWLRWAVLPECPFVAAWSLLVFLAAKRWLDRPYGRVVAMLSSLSFGVYLLHPVILNLLYKAFDVVPGLLPPLIFELTIWVVASVFALLGTAILKKLPLVSKII